MLIFKRKKASKVQFPAGVVVHVNEKGWMDRDAMYLCLQKVWAFRPQGLRNKQSMLIWNSFSAHLMKEVKDGTHRWYV